MKAWRRTSSTGRVVDSLLPAPELSALGVELLQLDGVAAYVGTKYVLVQYSLDGFTTPPSEAEWPIDVDPYTIDAASYTGFEARAAITIGDLIPISAFSNVVTVP